MQEPPRPTSWQCDAAAGHERLELTYYQHMIEEYARHNGHADLIRECIDGTVGD
jgi:Protein of unknown function (DUF664)